MTERLIRSALDLGPKPRLGYAESDLDRATERRGDAAALASFKTDAASRAYLIGGEHVLLKKQADVHDPLFTAEEVARFTETREMVLLGRADGASRFAVALDPATVESLKAHQEIDVIDLRSIAVRGLVDPAHLAALAEGKAVLTWHARHRFCANCGAVTRVVDAGWRRDCPSCQSLHFPRTDLVVIMLATAGERCLLGRSHRFQPGMWSCLAGFVEPGETIEDAVRRETREEAGIACGRVAYFASQPWPFPMSLMIGCHAQALSHDIVIDRTELDDARWFERADVVLMLAGRHPDKLWTPPPIAIAHHIMRAWVEGQVAA